MHSVHCNACVLCSENDPLRQGICGDQCFNAITEAAIARADFKVPCDGGFDGAIDTLKRCISENGFEWQDCDGKSLEVIRGYVDKVQCIGGGTLKDKMEGGSSDDGKGNDA